MMSCDRCENGLVPSSRDWVDTLKQLRTVETERDALAMAARGYLVAPYSKGAIDIDAAKEYLAELVNAALNSGDGEK